MPKRISLYTEIPTEVIKIVSMLSKGKTVAQISKEKELSTRTIEDRIFRARLTFECKNVAHLVAVFLRNKLIK